MDNGLSIQILICYKIYGTDTWSNKSRSSPFWRLYWNSNDGADLTFNETVVALGPSTVVLIPPNTPFDKHTRCDVHHFFIHFTVSYSLGTLPPGLYDFAITTEIKKEIDAVISLLNSGQSETPRFLLLTQLIVTQGLFELSEKIKTPEFNDQRLMIVASYMDAHVSEKILNADLAQLIGMNTNAFIHFFKQKAKVTPMKFLEMKRFQKACNLLQFSTISIDHIAEQIGFCDRNHFTKTFTKLQKIGPGEFRRKALMER